MSLNIHRKEPTKGTWRALSINLWKLSHRNSAFRMKNLEALRLYRDVIRLARLFTWRNERHELLRDVLMGNARKEFEQARHEKDPLIVARLLFVGRDCLNQTRERLAGKYQQVQNQVDKSRTS